MATKPSSSAESNIDKNQQALSTNKDIQRQRQQALMAALQKKAASLQNDRTNTTDEEARRNYVNWAVAVKTDKPETLNIAGIYPKDACPRRLSGNAVYGVLASTQGRATNVELIKSAGYPIFNQKAIEQINSFRFPNPTGNSKAYRVNVSFDYDSQTCPSYGNSSRIEATKSQPTPDNLPKNVNPATATPTTTKTPNNTPVETKRGSEPLAPPATRNAPSSAPPVEAKRELEPLAPPATRNAPSSAPPVEAKREPEPLAPPATRNAPSSIPPVEAKREPEPLAPNEPQASPNLPKPTAQKSTTEAESLAPEAPAKVQPGAEILPAAPPAPTKTDPAREQE
jgi:TonB family protein